MRPRLAKKGKGPAPRLVVRIAPETLEELKRLAAADRRNMSDMARILIEDGIAALRKRGK